MHTQSRLVLVTGALLLVNTALRVQNALRRIQNWPGYRVLFTTRYIFGTLLPFESIGYLYREAFKVWKDKHSEFAEHGVDIISGLVVFPYPNVVMMVADASAVKEITAHRSRFPKPLQPYKTIDVFGANIVGSEGEEWKRHKKISAPAFSEPNNKMVWDETARVMSELVNDVWGTSQEVTVDHATTLTLPIALFIIGSAGFGQRISWEEEQVIPPGHQMSSKEALHILSTDAILKAIIPDWILKYGPTRLRRVGKAFIEMKTYMTEMVQHRKSWHAEERHHDLFSNLLKANDEDADITLSDSELLGNIFVFLLAGHETTAHTLCFSLALLALYQDEQTKMYQNIQKVMAHKQVPTYEDAPSLAYCQAVFYETLRLFPPLPVIQKLAAEDTVLSTVNAAGETVTVPIPAGAGIGIHTPGLHYNPRYWDDPYTFKPSRFLGEWPRDAFVPFSEGARSCLGRRFSETEATVILAMLVSRYKIEVKEEAQFSGETFEQRKERILKARPGLTLTPVKVPLVFKRR